MSFMASQRFLLPHATTCRHHHLTLTYISLQQWLLTAPHTRSFAASTKMATPAKKAKKVEEARPPVDPNRPIDVSFLHVLKASPVPKLLPDEQYPEWIWDATLLTPPTLLELNKRSAAGEVLTPDLIHRKQKLERKAKIKEWNESHRKV